MTLLPSPDPAALYRVLAESAPDPILTIDAHSVIVAVNPAAERVFGYGAAEMVGQPLQMLMPERFRAAHTGGIARYLTTGERRISWHGVRVPIQPRDGEEIPVEISFGEFEADGQRLFAGFLRDVSAQVAHERVVAEANVQLQEQAVELEYQIEEAQALTEELEHTNEELLEALGLAEAERAAAQRSETRFRRLFEDSPLPMWVYDSRTLRFLEVNATAVRQYGYSAAEFLHLTLRDVRPPEEQAVLDRSIALRVPGQTSRTRTRHRTRDGSILEVEVSTQDAHLGDREARLAVVVDVTERTRAEERERFLAAATEALGASLDIGATLQHVARLAVPALADWCLVELAREPGDAGTLELVTVEHVDPARVEHARAFRRRYPASPEAPGGIASVLRTQQSMLAPVLGDDALVAAATDQEHLSALRAFGFGSAIVVPLIAHGTALGALTLASAESMRRYNDADLALAEELGHRAALSVDNARRYAAEQMARNAAEAAARRVGRLQSLTAALSATLTPPQVADVIIEHGLAALGARAGAVATIDHETGDLVLLGSAGYTASAVAQFARLSIDSDFPLAEAARLGEAIVLATAEERDARYPHLAALRRSNGSGPMASAPLVVDGRLLGALGLNFPDDAAITSADRQFLLALAQQCAQALERARLFAAERAARDAAEEARARAEEANEAKSQFLASMSHELRTPLNAIGGHVELVDMGLHGPVTTAQREALGRVRRAQEHLLGLITDVLNYAQLEAGRVEYHLQHVALAAVVQEVTALVAPLVGTKGLAFDVMLPEPALGVWADAEKLRQVLLNLLSNAVKFTASGGRIAVDVIIRDAGVADAEMAPADGVFVRVSDTGVGIPADKLEAVFAPFVQVETGFTRAAGGTGLGLAISRDLARGMGGELRARSQTGVGSTFTLALRRSVAAADDQVSLGM
jgi:PAS domain S-box-containing protein